MSDRAPAYARHLRHSRRSLASADALRPVVAERSRALVADIRRSLDSGDPQPPKRRRSPGGSSEAALGFEASHPTLAGTVGSVIDALCRDIGSI